MKYRKIWEWISATVLVSSLCLVRVQAESASPESVLAVMKRVADWQLGQTVDRPPHDWTRAPFLLGLLDLHEVSGDPRYLDAVRRTGEQIGYGAGPRLEHADDYAVLQAWLELYRRTGDKAQLQPSVDHFARLQESLAGRRAASVAGGSFTWSWCDALFMAPAVWVQLGRLTSDPNSVAFADREWWTTTDVLYDPQDCLFFRDNRFWGRRTDQGRKQFWGRGNGWVAAGLVRVLDHLPADFPSRSRYLGLYHDMMKSLARLQGRDGLWRSSLTEPERGVGESSASGLIVYAMSWGVNRGLLARAQYESVVNRGWQALAAAVRQDGSVGGVQRISDQPGDVTAKDCEIYGSGAFLLAGAEIVRGQDPDKQRALAADWRGVHLPSRYLREQPRVHARFAPDRSDDFIWENDLIAFRAYGPALRAGEENSGFDAMCKRVPYPVIDQWYLANRTKLPHAKQVKSYHEDYGEGADLYKVGDTRGCGGISLWIDGQPSNSDAFIAHRILQQDASQAVFELDYAHRLPNGSTARETKRIRVLMGSRMFQVVSKFTVDGKAGAVDVAIGLKPQTGAGRAEFDAAAGVMKLWEVVGGLGFGTAVVVPGHPEARMLRHSDARGQQQDLVICRTDSSGRICWYAGYGWEGQGEILTSDAWGGWLGNFAERLTQQPEPVTTGLPEHRVHDLPAP